MTPAQARTILDVLVRFPGYDLSDEEVEAIKVALEHLKA